MTVTQILGAKVQPTFAEPTEWNSTRTYAPLTIVLHEGNSYTSKQYVPKGIDIANEDFWALTGNYNAQVEGYRKEVLTFDGRITENTNDIVAETKRAKAAEKAITDDMVNKMLVIGDSYSDYLYSGDLTTDSSLWWYKLAKALNLTPTKYAKSGAGFVRKSDGINFNTLLTNAISEIKDKERYRYVFVMGGLNDISQDDGPDLNTFNSTYVNFIIKLKNNFPYSTIVICGPNTFINNEQNTTTGLNQYNVAEKMKTGCFALPGVYIDISKTLLGHGSQFNTYKHPNSDGEDRLAGEVLNGLLGRESSNNVWLPTAVTNILSITPNTNNHVTAAKQEQVQWYFTSKGIHVHTMITLTIDNATQVNTSKALATGTINLGIKGKNLETYILCSGRRFNKQNTAATNYAIVNAGANTQFEFIDNGSDFSATTEATMSLWYDFDLEVLA